MVDPISMEDILADKNPEPVKETAPEPAAKAPLEIPKLGDKPLAEEPKIERPLSRRAAHRDREQAAQGRIRDPETGQFSPKAEEPPKEETKVETAKAEEPAKTSAAPQQEFTDKEKAFLRAAQEERGKRQELEKRLAALEAAKPAPAATTEQSKGFWEDPDGALAKEAAEREKQKAEIRQEIISARLSTAEAISRQKHPDFDEKVKVFADVLQQTPGLHVQWLAAADPAEFAYSLGKNHLELQEAGSIDGLRAKIEKETRIKLEGELKEKAEKLAKERAALPPSLSEAPSKGTNKIVWSGPTPMDDILHG